MASKLPNSLFNSYRPSRILAAVILSLLFGCSTSNQSSNDSAWEGTWELSEEASGEKVSFVLRPDQKVYLITPDPPLNDASKGIELPLTKVSDKTDLPENVEPTSLLETSQDQASKAREARVESTIGAINRAQQAYRLEHPTFASTFQELGLGDGPGLDDIYDVQIVSANPERAYVTAIAKRPDSKSFSGVVTVEDGLTSPKTCSTKSASQTPPPIDLLSKA